MTTLNDFIMCCAGTGRFCKKVCLAFSLVHISFLRILFIWPMLNSNFSIKFSSLLNILISSRSVNIHVIKIITRNLADVWHIIFSSDLPNILLCLRIGICYKIKVKLKFCAQPMHQLYVIKYCILLKTISSEWEWVTRHKSGFRDGGFQVWKSHCRIKSSFPLPSLANLIKTLPTGAISKLMIKTRDYTLLNPVSLLWTFPFPNFPFPWLIIL